MLGRHQGDLGQDVRRRRLLRYKSQLEVVDDPVHHRELGDKGNDAYLAAALGTKQWVDFINLADHGGPAAAGDSRTFLLDDQETMLVFL